MSCIDPKEFGPHYWAVIHMACLNRGPDHASELLKFVHALPGILPCLNCTEHLEKNLVDLPFDPKDPFRWSVNLHNTVNKQLGKPVISYEQALQHWNGTCKPKKSYMKLIILVILFILYLLLK
jgi:hypothetical protein